MQIHDRPCFITIVDIFFLGGGCGPEPILCGQIRLHPKFYLPRPFGSALKFFVVAVVVCKPTLVFISPPIELNKTIGSPAQGVNFHEHHATHTQHIKQHSEQYKTQQSTQHKTAQHTAQVTTHITSHSTAHSIVYSTEQHTAHHTAYQTAQQKSNHTAQTEHSKQHSTQHVK